MGTSETTPIKGRYGSFALAATAYIAGVLLFSLWSYTAHRNALLTHTDKSLTDAAFSLQEILISDYVQSLSEGSDSNQAKFDRKQQSLSRIALHGKFNVVAVLSIHNKNIKEVISASIGTDSGTIHNARPDDPIPRDVRDNLLRLAATGKNDANLLTADHLLTSASYRYSVLYQAINSNSGIAYLVAQNSAIMEKELADQALRLAAVGLGMLLLAIPLITLFGRTQKKTAAALAEMNIRLQHDVELQKTREVELKDAIKDLERFNAVSAGRESRVIKLKAEVNALLEQLKRDKRYNIDKID